MQRVRAAISLGPNCRGKYHLHRVFADASPSGVFDWQVTPVEAIHCYLRQDFAGLFERADLVVRTGVVWNARYGTSHQHEFPGTSAPGSSTPAIRRRGPGTSISAARPERCSAVAGRYCWCSAGPWRGKWSPN
jgi:hypothetical protein